MNRALLASLLGGLLLFASACKSKPDDKEAIRDGVVKYLASLNTLNVNAMDIVVTEASVNGNQAQAQVEVRVKNDPTDGASMKLSYNLERRGEEWAVVKSQAMGGSMAHPGSVEMPPGGAMPPGHPNISGSSDQAAAGHPDFNEIMKSAQPPAQQPPVQQPSSPASKP